MKFFASCAKGLEYLLVDELLALGCRHATATMAGANVEGTLADAQRAVLWSRLASRILWPIAEFECADEHALFAGAMAVDWPAHLDASTTIAVDAHVSGDAITHARYAALRVKDAVCDVLRERVGDRPDVDTEAPDVRIDLLVRKGIAIISIDLAGPLHKRGWRQAQGEAPLKENLAAAVLMRGNWPAVYADGGGLLDPMCGSGTLLIEGALMAADVAPGLLRHGDAWPTRWFGFERAVWTSLVEEARARETAGRAALRADLVGSDSDPHAIYAAEQNAWAAGVSNAISWQVLDVESLETAQVDPRGALTTGLVVCNPPYDARLQADAALYRALGDGLRRAVPTWRASILCGNPALAQATGLRAGKRYQLFNGALECLLIVCERIGSEAVAMRPADAAARGVGADGDQRNDGGESTAAGAFARHAAKAAPAAPAIPLDPGAQMVANRLRKNIRKFASWRKRDGIACYRVYDADLPEYAAAIDVYTEAGNGQVWLHVQEYAAPSEIPEDTARGRLEALLAAAREVFDVPVQRVSLKTRLRGKGGSRYAQAGSANAPDMHGQFLVVREGDALLRINLFDHLDSGLFLDHRPMRLQLGAQAEDARFLNLFAYTGAATVHAALGGARTTTTVDLSPTYLQWAADNLQANGFSGGKHRLVQADALAWLEAETAQYDLIFCDPPTFSNSARAADFDLQREHVRLLQAAVARLAPGGVLYFSNNARRFKLDAEAVAAFATCEDISARSIDPDFARNPRIHQAWRLHALPA